MKYIGSYVQDFKKLCIASAVSGHNVMHISAPGWGKTEMARAAAEAVAGSDGSLTVEIDPSSPPEIIKGVYDPAQMLQGKVVKLIENTPYDPTKHIIVLDEVWRGNDPLFDSLLHATSMKGIDPATRPVFWGTSNFVGKAERTAALRDRFALWNFMGNLDLDSDGIVEAHLLNGYAGIDPSWAKDFPSWDECVRIRRTHPGTKALDAIKDLVNQIIDEANNAKFSVNPRRVTQWSELLYFSTVLATGTEDFDAIPASVTRLLQYAYPCTDEKIAGEWRTVALSIGDKVGAAIEAVMGMAVEAFNQVKTQAASDPAKRATMSIDLAMKLTEAQTKLEEISSKHGDEERITTAIGQLASIYRKALRNEKLE